MKLACIYKLLFENSLTAIQQLFSWSLVRYWKCTMDEILDTQGEVGQSIQEWTK